MLNYLIPFTWVSQDIAFTLVIYYKRFRSAFGAEEGAACSPSAYLYSPLIVIIDLLHSAVLLFYTSLFYLFGERRDEARCLQKYKEIWVEYRKLLPWRMLPYVY